MATDPLLDFAALLAPVPGDDPAGSGVPFDVRHKLEEARKQDDPDDYAADDPRRPETLKKADWASIVRLTQQTLANTAKDLLVAARLTEALVRQHGFAGLRDGLHLLRALVDDCWDRLYPPIEDDDLEVRATPFYWLDDAEKGARFPTTVRTVPIVFGQDAAYSWLDWQRSTKGEGTVSREDFDAAMLATPVEHFAASTQELAQSLGEIAALSQSLATRLGPAAPGLTAVRQAVEECHTLATQILARRGGAPQAADAAAPGASVEGDGTGAAATAGQAPATRAEAYRRLAEAANLLQQLEPHSPIPYLVQRAVALGSLPFPQLMRALIRDTSVLDELNRELGIKEPESS